MSQFAVHYRRGVKAKDGQADKPVVCRDPEIMSGTPVFCGTRVPVRTLLDYLEAGDPIDEFLEGFPSVSREQVIAFLEQAVCAGCNRGEGAL